MKDPARTKIAHGSIRSSKTTAQIFDWLHWVPDAPPGPLAIVGKTRDTIGRNILEVIQAEVPSVIKWRDGATSCTIMGRKHHLLGANDAQAETKVRGLTLAGVLVDEVTLLTEDFFTTLLGRLSVNGARLIGTTNPDSPNHWFKRKYLDRADDLGWSIWHFTMDDNPGLDPDYIARVSREYTGLYRRRFIDGEWVAAEGAIYTAWDPDRHVAPWADLPPMARYIGVGIDYGTTNPTDALLLGQDRLGGYWLVDEWRHDPATTNQRLTDEEQSKALRDWLLHPHTPHPTEPLIPEVTVDPAAAGFRVQLARDGIQTSPANNDVTAGIQALAHLLATGRLKVTDKCPGFINEVTGYSWDPKATKKGEDTPIKTADHALDAARYAVMLDDPTRFSSITGMG
ncbi:PBSX family phage terminase large subunit [Candidatus Gracilibacteria bacterium]|nr:PBSX family phage terminase large subunit [Candidatus Gracilibacteria bacterium]